MTPADINLIIYQGATFKKEFQWKIGNPATAVDMTGFTIRMQIREKLKDDLFVVELTTENSKIVISDPTDGRFYLILDDTETADLTIKSGVYDIEVVDLSGTVERLIKGSVSISPEVTRPIL